MLVGFRGTCSRICSCPSFIIASLISWITALSCSSGRCELSEAVLVQGKLLSDEIDWWLGLWGVALGHDGLRRLFSLFTARLCPQIHRFWNSQRPSALQHEEFLFTSWCAPFTACISWPFVWTVSPRCLDKIGVIRPGSRAPRSREIL